MLELVALPAYVLMHTVCLGEVPVTQYGYVDKDALNQLECYKVTTEEFDKWQASLPQTHNCVTAAPRYLDDANIWVVNVSRSDSWDCR